MLELPLFAELRRANRVLVAGAGGGYDLFCGLPLFFALRDAGKEAFLANLSFSPLHLTGARRLAYDLPLYEASADASPAPYINYFPEGYLARWFRSRGEEVSVWCFERSGARPLRASYEALIDRLKLDALVLVDGGTDSLMRGDEEGLGTPHEDVCSLAATEGLDLPVKVLACLGFGVDHYHGVCHAHFLEAVAELTRAGAFLGAFSLTADMPEARRYVEATRSVFVAMPDHPSIVSSSIVSALEGRHGDYHATDRTHGSKLYINPLMTLYWAFQLAPVARRVLYLDALRQTDTWDEVHAALVTFLAGRAAVRPSVPIPL
jgi:hypothetical protein